MAALMAVKTGKTLAAPSACRLVVLKVDMLAETLARRMVVQLALCSAAQMVALTAVLRVG